ncbi:MAG: hypothetical protein AAFR21_09470 [Pseudomonadota bacterium]
MSLDVRKEQLVLLKFEKKLAGLAAFVAAGSATAASAANKVGDEVSLQAYNDIQQALINLADVTSEAHAALQAKASEAGVRALEISGGVPKDPPAQVVRSLLGLG